MTAFPDPKPGTVFYEDENIYACLAFHPVVKGHSIVVWKKDVEDLNKLLQNEYEWFMHVVYYVRAALLDVFKTDKVYMCYFDEAMHVHVHLYPRNPISPVKGPNLVAQQHGELGDNFFDLAESLQKAVERQTRSHSHNYRIPCFS